MLLAESTHWRTIEPPSEWRAIVCSRYGCEPTDLAARFATLERDRWVIELPNDTTAVHVVDDLGHGTYHIEASRKAGWSAICLRMHAADVPARGRALVPLGGVWFLAERLR